MGVEPGARLLVAVSGGVDSVVLLHLLRFGCREDGYVLRAAHFDHRMREGSGADAAWVEGLCRAWNVPLVRGEASAPLRNETVARTARYEFLQSAMAETESEFLLTAHHADDQIETVLFRMLRGTGLAGVAGIPSRRGQVLRPLLPFRRKEIMAYAREAGLSYRDDPTNLDARLARNRIRHEVIPFLERSAPGFGESVLRLARAVACWEAVWEREVKALADAVTVESEAGMVQLARTELLGYHRQVRARVIRHVLRELGGTPGRAGTRAALAFIRSGASGARIELAGGLRVERHFHRIVVRQAAGAATNEPLIILEPESGSGRAVIGGRAFRAEWSVGEAAMPSAVSFPTASLTFPLELRAWKPGDRIRLRGGTRKLKKYFGDRQIPRYRRHSIPVLAEPGGQVIWIVGMDQAWAVQPTAGEKVFRIRVTHGDDS